jgi:hypothetical protein
VNTRFRKHLISALSRGFLTAIALIHANSVYVAKFGSENYSLIVFYAQVACMALYFTFLFTSKRVMTLLYCITLIISLGACAALWKDNESRSALFAFALGAFVIDVIGINVVSAKLVDEVSTSVFGRV